AQNLPRGTKFAMSEYGFAGANSAQIEIIDPLGLHDPFFAHHGFSSDNFFSRKPDLIWFPHSDYAKIIAAIQSAPEFWRDYDYYPNAFDYGLAVRKNDETIYAKVEEAWRGAYPNLDMKSYLAKETIP
ncbi:MAG: hypothetical protein PHQ36_10245, partial [Anaerolineales bacterium]|nr:hypothetical protein [Anaerolineales bacterium]